MSINYTFSETGQHCCIFINLQLDALILCYFQCKPKKYFQNIIITHNEDAKIIFKQVLTNFRTIIHMSIENNYLFTT